jgi:hypothetical protein
MVLVKFCISGSSSLNCKQPKWKMVDLGLTSVGRFDSADSVISVNDGN